MMKELPWWKDPKYEADHRPRCGYRSNSIHALEVCSRFASDPASFMRPGVKPPAEQEYQGPNLKAYTYVEGPAGSDVINAFPTYMGLSCEEVKCRYYQPLDIEARCTYDGFYATGPYTNAVCDHALADPKLFATEMSKVDADLGEGTACPGILDGMWFVNCADIQCKYHEKR